MFRKFGFNFIGASLIAGLVLISTTAEAMPVVNATHPTDVLAPKLKPEAREADEKTKSFLNSLPTMQEIMRPAVSPPAARISALHDGSDARRLIDGPNGTVGLVPRPG